MIRTLKSSLFSVALLISMHEVAAQQTDVHIGAYLFKSIKDMEAGPVQNQGQTGTCWAFSGISFFQAELIRKNKAPVDLSEMFVVRELFPLKAVNYTRMHGKANFGEGGEFTDDLLCLREFGMVPISVYDGNRHGSYHYTKMMEGLDSCVKTTAASETKIDPAAYQAKVNSLLDKYMTAPPQQFDYDGKSYTPKSFASAIGLNPDDYVMITSFSHHPFYKPFILEVPDNWNWQQFYNVPLEDLTVITENALKQGYTVAWSADVSEKGFDYPDGLALVPEQPIEPLSENQLHLLFQQTVNEKTITQEMRQQAFDDYETQDDHGMHIVGLYTDQSGKPFFKVKNSWGTAHSAAAGYFYASKPYFEYKTTSIMVNKKALPRDIAKKLRIKI